MTEEQQDRPDTEEEVTQEESPVAEVEESPSGEQPVDDKKSGWPVAAIIIAAVLALFTIIACIAAAVAVVVTPLLVGDRIGLHPVTVMFAVLAGGQLFGFMGILLALPLAAVLVVLVRHARERYKDSDWYGEEESRAQPESGSQKT